jgi:hypothetical protein
MINVRQWELNITLSDPQTDVSPALSMANVRYAFAATLHRQCHRFSVEAS